MPRWTAYSKVDALERIFVQKFDASRPADEIPFTRSEVRQAIIDTGGTPPDNLNNFVKDLTRSGSHNGRAPSARAHEYGLREGTHTETMGVFFKIKPGELTSIAVRCPPDLHPTPISIALPPDIADLVRPDEGGLLSVLEYGHVLDAFLGVPPGSVKRVQSPVKIQPYELDAFFVLRLESGRIAIPIEAKSNTRDEITLNQIVGIAESSLRRLLHADMQSVIPTGAKVLSNGDIFLVSFPRLTVRDLSHLQEKLVASAYERQARYRLVPRPPRWPTSRANGAQRPLL